MHNYFNIWRIIVILTELFRDKTLEELLVGLTKKYDVQLNNGNFAIVLVPKNKPYVYKIWQRDPAFEAYIDFCIKNQHLSFVYKLQDIKIRTIKLPTIRDISHKDAEIKVIKLPKLRPATVADFSDYFKSLPQDIDMSLRHAAIGFSKELTPMGHDWIESILSSGVFNLRDSDNQTFNKDFRLDNIMVDTSGNLILTDPIWTIKNVGGIAELMDTMDTPSYSPKPKILSVSGRNATVSSNQTKYIPQFDRITNSNSIEELAKLSISELLYYSKEQRIELAISIITRLSSHSVSLTVKDRKAHLMALSALLKTLSNQELRLSQNQKDSMIRMNQQYMTKKFIDIIRNY